MRRLLTVAGFTVASAGLLAAPVAASTPLPNGAYYGGHSGTLRATGPSCPVTPPSGTTGSSTCLQMKGPFTVVKSGGKKLTGTYVGNLATGDTDTSATGVGNCSLTNAVFTFTVGKGNTFKAAIPPGVTSYVDRTCFVLLSPSTGPHDPVVLTTVFHLQITGGTGRFKGLTGTIDEGGAAVPNVDSTGANTNTARINGNFGMLFGAN